MKFVSAFVLAAGVTAQYPASPVHVSAAPLARPYGTLARPAAQTFGVARPAAQTFGVARPAATAPVIRAAATAPVIRAAAPVAAPAAAPVAAPAAAAAEKEEEEEEEEEEPTAEEKKEAIADARSAADKARDALAMTPKHIGANYEESAKMFGIYKNMDDFADDKTQLNLLGKYDSMFGVRVQLDEASEKLRKAREAGDTDAITNAQLKHGSLAAKHTYKMLEAFKGDSYKKVGDASLLGMQMRGNDLQLAQRAYQSALEDDADEKTLSGLRSKMNVEQTEFMAQLMFAKGEPDDGKLIFFGADHQQLPTLVEKFNSAQEKYREDPTDKNYLKMQIANLKHQASQSSATSWLAQHNGCTKCKLIDALFQGNKANSNAQIEELEQQLRELEYAEALGEYEELYSDFYGSGYTYDTPSYGYSAGYAAPAYGSLLHSTPVSYPAARPYGAISHAAPARSYGAAPYQSLYGR